MKAWELLKEENVGKKFLGCGVGSFGMVHEVAKSMFNKIELYREDSEMPVEYTLRELNDMEFKEIK